uniref:putative reverse transcriptase/maturase n=1 Tax=Goniotrichopsis reniformis TaxID=468933 RepID=UPI001FCDFAAA|nr:putative reverse transcriptase/maturase [Goniotrichopsis reniformis]UNJ14717.1 putative reverse transcriptase/maturase [Goniotrichopsis reniformis]
MSKKKFNHDKKDKFRLGWNKIYWKKRYQFIYSIQESIYKAALRGDINNMTQLQKTLLASVNTKLVVTKGIIESRKSSINNLTKIKLALSLRLYSLTNLYPYWQYLNLDIDYFTFYDIYTQSIARIIHMILEPQWEAYFESGILGIRSLYSEKDALVIILQQLRKNKFNYAISAKISDTFNTNHYKIIFRKLHNSYYINWFITKFFKEYKSQELYSKLSLIKSNSTQRDTLLFNILNYGLQYHIQDNTLFQKIRFSECLSNTSIIYLTYGYNLFILCYSNLQKKILVNTLKIQFKALNLYLEQNTIVINYTSTKINFLGFSIILHSNNIYLIPDLINQKQLIYSIRKILYKKDSLGRTRALSHLTLEEAIYKINPLIKLWYQYYVICTNNYYFIELDRIINNTIYRWQIKKYKLNTVKSWNKQCIKHIKGNRRIAQGKAILRLLSEEKSKRKFYFIPFYYRSAYDQDREFWNHRGINHDLLYPFSLDIYIF